MSRGGAAEVIPAGGPGWLGEGLRAEGVIWETPRGWRRLAFAGSAGKSLGEGDRHGKGLE